MLDEFSMKEGADVGKSDSKGRIGVGARLAVGSTSPPASWRAMMRPYRGRNNFKGDFQNDEKVTEYKG